MKEPEPDLCLLSSTPVHLRWRGEGRLIFTGPCYVGVVTGRLSLV